MVFRGLAKAASLVALLGALAIGGSQTAYKGLGCTERTLASSEFIQNHYMKPHERAVVNIAEHTNNYEAVGLGGLAAGLYYLGRRKR